MRWDELFADLEAQADLLAARERAEDVGELARAEAAALGLVERLTPSVGARVSVSCHGNLRVTGELARTGPDWMLVREDAGREALIALRAVLSVAGLIRLSAPAGGSGPIESRLGLRSALRGVARDRSSVGVHLVDATVVMGTLDRVGADFFELATHPGAELRRRGDVLDVLVVPLSAVAAVRRLAG